MHNTRSKQIKPETDLYLCYQRPHRSAPNERVPLLPKTDRGQRSPRNRCNFFIPTSFLTKQINSCEINQDGQNAVGGFLLVWGIFNEKGRFWHLVPLGETLTRHWNFVQQKDNDQFNTGLDLCHRKHGFMFLFEPENLEIWTTVCRITEYHWRCPDLGGLVLSTCLSLTAALPARHKR